MSMTSSQQYSIIPLQEDVAVLNRRARVTLSYYIGRLETGRHDPQLSTLTKLAKALKVRVGELIARI